MDDIWLHVFYRLHPRELIQFETVSTRWKDLIADVLRKRSHVNMERDFPGCFIEPEAMRQVIERHSPALTSIEISVKPKTERFMVCASQHHLTRKVVRQINRTAGRLKRVKVERMNLTIGAVEEIALLPSSLRELSIVNCSLSCDSPEVCLLAQNSFRVLFQRCQQLRKFEIMWRGYCFEHFELTDELLSHLPDSVEELNISAGNSLRITSLEFLEGKRLRSFALQRSFISAIDLKYLLPMASGLQFLDLTSCINILDVSAIGSLYNLRHLWLGNMREGVDDLGLLTVLTGCQLLESLCLENLPQLTEKSLCGLGSLKHLKKMEASGVAQLNDQCCHVLARSRKLEYLDIKFCRNVTASGLRSILSLPRLSHLEILGIPAFSAVLLKEFDRLPSKIVRDNYTSSCPLILPKIPAPA